MAGKRGPSKGRKVYEVPSFNTLFVSPGAGVNPLLAYDQAFDKTPVAGIDEVGRGPLAGPIVAAAVILPPDKDLPGVKDSKKLTHEERVRLSDIIKDAALAWALAFKTPQEVDELNPLQATIMAMADAYSKLAVKPLTVLVDGTIRPPIDAAVVPLVHGDAKSLSIAAASIIAKVARDIHMLEEHIKYPHYGFDRHKGYGTKEHLLALSHYGPSPIHRLTYRSVRPDTAKPLNPLGTLF